jgi:hypothetical protein
VLEDPGNNPLGDGTAVNRQADLLVGHPAPVIGLARLEDRQAEPDPLSLPAVEDRLRQDPVQEPLESGSPGPGDAAERGGMDEHEPKVGIGGVQSYRAGPAERVVVRVRDDQREGAARCRGSSVSQAQVGSGLAHAVIASELSRLLGPTIGRRAPRWRR